jgi:lamin tail-like protein/putative Ig domain-containing protein
LYNTGTTAADLSGYYLSDNLTNTTKWAFPQGTFIQPHGFLLVWADDAPCQDTDLHALFKLSAGGEQIGLFAPDGKLIDGFDFPQQKDDVSYGRWPDGVGATFFAMNQPTPRTANLLATSNAPPAVGPIPDKSVDELALLSFTATADDPDGSVQQLSFSLDPNAPDGASINAQSGLFTWQPTEDQGPGIYTIVVLATDNGSPPLSGSRSFRVTVNEVNQPPVLSPIPDQSVSLGAALNFTANATDADLPAQSLNFTLDPGAPEGATINSVSGLFAWTPLPSQAPSTNAITVRVTDNGPPSLSATRTFTAIVREIPAFTASAVLANNVVTLTWQATAGKTYQVQFRTDLTSGDWQALGPNVQATGSIATTTDALTGTQRFYRVLQLD